MQCLSCASWSTAQTEARAFLKATSVPQLSGRSERLGRPFFLQHAFSRCVTTVASPWEFLKRAICDRHTPTIPVVSI
jgi:hypothetical protein